MLKDLSPKALRLIIWLGAQNKTIFGLTDINKRITPVLRGASLIRNLLLELEQYNLVRQLPFGVFEKGGHCKEAWQSLLNEDENIEFKKDPLIVHLIDYNLPNRANNRISIRAPLHKKRYDILGKSMSLPVIWKLYAHPSLPYKIFRKRVRNSKMFTLEQAAATPYLINKTRKTF